MRSIRARLLIGILAGTAVTLSATGWMIHSAHRTQLFELFDASLEMATVALSGQLEFERDQIEFEGGDPSASEANRPGLGGPHVQVFNRSGRSLFRSQSLGDLDLPMVVDESRDDPTVVPFRDSAGMRHRALSMTIDVPVEDEHGEHEDRDDRGASSPGGRSRATRSAVIVVAASTEDLWARSHQHAMLILRCCALAVVGAGIIAWVVVQFGLRPLRPLARQISETTPETLAVRIDMPDGASELAPVVARLNELLARLDDAFQRERTLSANVAHELRTPITALISTIEVSLRRPRSDEDYVIALGECLTVARGMQHVVSSLLAMAKLESGETRPGNGDLPVWELVESEWRGLEPDPTQRGVLLERRGAEEAVIHADRDLMRLVLANALSNAARHAPDKSAVLIRYEPNGQAVRLVIENDGCDVSPDDADKVFDRFWRSDRARTDANVHCGLGATLIRRAVTAMNGTATARVRGDRFTLVLEIPDPSRDADPS